MTYFTERDNHTTMTTQFPEHFLALIKQEANLQSLAQAQRLTLNINEALEVTLQEDRKKLYFGYAPEYLTPRKTRLFTRALEWNKHYRHVTLIERLMLTQNLSDTTEAESYLKAYFSTMRIVSGPKTFQKIYSILPRELQSLASFSQAHK